jgi:H+/Cl- antiporter ClcA
VRKTYGVKIRFNCKESVARPTNEINATLLAMTKIIEIILLFAAAYLALGGVFALVFLAKGLRQLDHATRDAGLFFRLLITPGVIVLWPWLAVKWRRAAPGGGFAGFAEAPVSPRAQRRVHLLLVKTLIVLLPLMFAAGLYFRAKETPSSPLPCLPLPPNSATVK